MGLLRTLRPEWWFSAHLHCRFEATVRHEGMEGVGLNEGSSGGVVAGVGVVEERNPDEIVIEDEGFADEDTPVPAPAPPAAPAVPAATEPPPQAITNPDEIILDDEEEDVVKPPPPPPPPLETKFLALDKCLPQRQFLEVRSRLALSLYSYILIFKCLALLTGPHGTDS